MREGWEMRKLKEVSKTGAGGTPKKSFREYYEGGKIPWLQSGAVAQGEIHDSNTFITELGLKNSSAKLFPKDTVLVAMYGATAGQVGILRFEACTNQAVCGILPSKDLIPEYTFYYFLSQKSNLLAQAVGNAQPNISQAKIKETPIPVPPLAVQRRIVSRLDAAFGLLDSAQVNVERSLELAGEIWESVLEERMSSNATKTKPLKELADSITDGDHMPPPKSASGVPFITIRNINKESNEIDFTSSFHVPHSYYENLKESRTPRVGDILYTVTGSYGIPVLIDYEKKFCFQRHIGIIKPSRSLESKWLYYWVQSRDAKRQADDKATGTAQKTVSLKSLRGLKVPVKDLEAQQKDIRFIEGFYGFQASTRSNYATKLDHLTNLRSSLLEKAFSGDWVQTS